VEITFAKKRLQKTCESKSKLQREHGAPCAKKLMTRLSDLAAVETLEEMRGLPGNCHELEGDRDGQLSVEGTDGKRLIFEPSEEPIPAKDDGGLDWSGVESIRILDLIDYH
jgi:toxin HigB-1